MEKINRQCAGIDVGSAKVFMSPDGKEVISYETFTTDFRELVKRLKSLGITSVAMEATGVYWVILYEMIQAAGIEVYLIDARQTKQVPGRKTDVKDAQWIQQLHSYGLLNRCHVTVGQIQTLKVYQRMREDHIGRAATHVNHMQKALTQMNIRLSEVLSQVHGKSGLSIIRAILAGERDKQKLLDLCATSIKKRKSDEVLKALEGFYNEEQLFALQQSYDGYEFYQKQIEQCDQKLDEILTEISANKDDVDVAKKRKAIRHHKPKVKELAKMLVKISQGKDPTILPGITDYTHLRLLGELGMDLSIWPSEKKFTSWLGLAPGQNNSGKKNRNKSKAGKFRAGQIFRQSARSIIQSKTIALGAFGRRIKARKGPGIAVKATARKLAEMYWRVMVKGSDYVEKGIEQYQEQYMYQRMKYVHKLAKQLNMSVSHDGYPGNDTSMTNSNL
ncbi:MAG: IS110 family transposase [Saprospiraceae bacterium]|nr:IS110 family transposase [Saprospiraceae bacterium]